MLVACRGNTSGVKIACAQNYVDYSAVYEDSIFHFKRFDIKSNELGIYRMDNRIGIVNSLDSFKILNETCDTIYEVWYEGNGMRSFAYIKTGKGEIGISYRRGTPVYTLNPSWMREDYYYRQPNESLLSEGIVSNPDSVMMANLYKWDIEAVADFFKTAMSKYYAIEAWKYVVNNGTICNIEHIYVANSPYEWNFYPS